MRNKLFLMLSYIVFGIIVSILWIIIGIPIYMNILSSFSLDQYSLNVGMKYMIIFLLGVPAIWTIFIAIFRKRLGYIVLSISFLIGTITFTLLIPILYK